MTTFASQRGAAAPLAESTLGAVTVRWSLATAAGQAVLAITLDERGASATVTNTGGEETSLAQGGPVRSERIEGIEHLDVAGVVSVSVRRNGGGAIELLYARTPLLESLGVAGGCIERPQVAAE